MIKRLIIDLDGTLISGVDFNIYAKRTLDKIGFDSSPSTLKIIQDAIDKYEHEANCYNIDEITRYFEEFLKQNIGTSFINQYLIDLCDAIPTQLEEGIIDTLDYLSKKYQLSILTNWFQHSQEERLKNAGLYNYFDYFVYGDKYKKPNPDAYIDACNDALKDECIMIGDSFDLDYEGAINAGVDAILLDKKDKYKDIVPEMKRIRKFSDLKERL